MKSEIICGLWFVLATTSTVTAFVPSQKTAEFRPCPLVRRFEENQIGGPSSLNLLPEVASNIDSSLILESGAIPTSLTHLWTQYNIILDAHPLYTKCATSLVGFTIGDFLAQNFIEKDDEPYDFVRTLRLASFGVLLHATSGHYFYGFLDDKFPGTEGTTVATKVAIDQILWAPVFTMMFFAYNSLLEGKSLEEYVAKLRSDLVTGVRGSWSYWTPAHIINFAFIPPSQRLLYINVLQVVYNIFLSFLGNKNVDTSDDEGTM